ERSGDGQGATGRIPGEGLLDDEVRWPHQGIDGATDRRVAAAAANGPYRPDAVSREHPAGGSGPFFCGGGGPGGGAGGQASGEKPGYRGAREQKKEPGPS